MTALKDWQWAVQAKAYLLDWPIVTALDFIQKHQFHYHSEARRLIEDGSTDKARLAIFQALTGHSGIVLHGPEYTPKRLIISSCGQLLGWKVYFLSCSQSFTHSLIASLAKATFVAGAATCLLDLQLLSQELLCGLAFCLAQVKLAIQSESSEVQIQQQKYRLDRKGIVFAEFNVAPNHRINRQVRWACRQVAVLSVDESAVIRAWMGSLGFRS